MQELKRSISWKLAIILGVAAIISACSAAPAATQPAGGTEEPGTEVAATETGTEATEAPAKVCPGDGSEGTLTVLEWAYYEVLDMSADFCDAHPNVDVTFNFGASDEDIFAKTQAGSGEDIMHFYTPFLKFYVDEGLIQEIDTSKLTHWNEVPKQFQDLCTLDGKVYCIPWDWGYTSILYRTDKIPEGIDSWSALVDEKYAGHISMWDSGPGAVTVGTYLTGYDETTLTADQLNEIKQIWIDQRPLNTFYWTSEPELVEGFVSGDVWLAYAWNGAYYSLLSEGVPVAYANPTEGRNSWVGQYAISANTENLDLALAFLDGKIAEKTAANLLTQYAYGHVNPTAYGAVTDANLIEALSLDDPTELDRTNFTVPITFDAFQQFVAMWAEVKAAP
jgi:spermidine/putrescine transport system substrate-binding protein